MMENIEQYKKKLSRIKKENRFFNKINSTLNYKKLSRLFLKKLLKILDFDGYFFSFLDESKEILTMEFVYLPDDFKKMENVILNSKIPLQQSPVMQNCILNNETIFIDTNNLDQYGEKVKDNFKYWNSESAVFIPISYVKEKDGRKLPEPIGLLCMFNRKKEFDREKISKVNALLSYFYYPLKAALYFKNFKEKEEKLKTAAGKNRKLLEIIETINSLKSLQDIYAVILKSIQGLFEFDIGLLFIAKENFLTYKTGYGVENEKIRSIFTNIDTFFKKEKGYEISLLDGATSVSFIRGNYFYFADISKILNLPMSAKDKEGLRILETPKSLLILPILKDKKPIGIIQFWSLTGNINLSDTDISILNLISSLIGSAIENSKIYTLVEAQKKEVEDKNTIIKNKNKQLMDELKLAKHIQESLIPSKTPELKGISFASIYKPMEEIGGDFFDFLKMKALEDKNLIGIFISDVSGHGVPAALITSMLKAIIETSAEFYPHPDQLLAFINNKITGQTGGNFLTAFYGVYNIQTKMLKYARGAHNYPYLIRDRKFIPVKSKGPLLGITNNIVFELQTIELKSGDKLIFYTDGLTETTNSRGDYFEDSLEGLLLQDIESPINVILDNCYHNLLRFREDYQFEDDVCIVGMEIE